MGKTNDAATKPKKKMSEVVPERRTIASNSLKRSKSVRASLRLIGTRFLHQKENEIRKMQKTPSLSSLKEHRNSLELNSQRLYNVHDDELPLVSPVETILKTPFSSNIKVTKNQFIHFGFRKFDSIRNKQNIDQQLELPPVIAPKAAAVLQIPIKENCEPLFFHRKLDKDSKSGKECDPQGRFREIEGGSHAFNGLQRTSLRLSISNARRKSSMWSSTSFSTSSMLNLIIVIIYLIPLFTLSHFLSCSLSDLHFTFSNNFLRFYEN